MRRSDREVKDFAEITKMLAESQVCRIAMFDETHPYLVPVNFGFDLDGSVLTFYFHCAPVGKKIELIAKNPHVCVELDGGHEVVGGETPCSSSFHYFGIIAQGTAEEITDLKQKNDALMKIVTHSRPEMQGEIPESALGGVAVYKIVCPNFSAKANR